MILCWPRRRHHVVRHPIHHAHRAVRRVFAPAAGWARVAAFTCIVIGGPLAAAGGGWWATHRAEATRRGVDTLQGPRAAPKSEASPTGVPEPASLVVLTTAVGLTVLLRRRL
jgi:hypothetical protein